MLDSKLKEENLKLKNDILSLEQQLRTQERTFKQKIYELREENISLQNELNNKINSTKQLFDINQSLKSEIDKLIQKIKQMELEISNTKTTIFANLREELSSKDKLIQTQNQKLSYYIEENKQLNFTIDSLYSQNQKLINELLSIKQRDESILNQLNIRDTKNYYNGLIEQSSSTIHNVLNNI
jgi:chromosome segregation ATPase